MQFDFSELYKTETLEVDGIRATFREVPNGAMEALQSEMVGDIALTQKKDGIEKQLNKRLIDFPEMATYEYVLAIQEWTFKGETMPNGDSPKEAIEIWRKLPVRIARQFEKVIERLNPKDSKDFPDGDGDGSES